jgi:hypothetical protein
LETLAPNKVATKYPMPGPIKTNPSAPGEKWYISEKRLENVANMRKLMPYILQTVRIADMARSKIQGTHRARYRLKMKQIKLWESNITGRLRFNHRICQMDSFFGGRAWYTFSESEHVVARRERMTGAYVSFKHGMQIKAAIPHNALMTMKTYLTPMFCAMKAPEMGPTTN